MLNNCRKEFMKLKRNSLKTLIVTVSILRDREGERSNQPRIRGPATDLQEDTNYIWKNEN